MIDLSIISIPIVVLVNAYLALWVFLFFVYFLKKPKPLIPVRSSTKISVLIPACNEEEVITNLLSDLDKQTWQDREIIVIVHNCLDNTFEKAKNFPMKTPTKIIELHTSKTGKALALQRGLQEATGEVICVFDTDNRVPPNFLEEGMKYIHAGYDGVQARIRSVNPKESLLTYLQDIEFTIYPELYCGAKYKIGLNSGIGGTGIMLSRDAIDTAGGYNNVLIEDYDMLIRLTLAKKRVAYASNLATYDEKVHSWRGLIRQRARWLAGYFQLWKRYSLKDKLRLLRYPIDFIYFFNPIFLMALISSYILSFIQIINVNITFFSIPLIFWISSTLFVNGCFTIMMHREGISWRKALLMPYQLLIFGLHWILALFYSIKVKGWNRTKTTHYGAQI